MPIVVACDACESRFKAKDELAGKAVRCPKCKTRIEIPGPATGRKPPNTAAAKVPTKPASVPVAPKAANPGSPIPPAPNPKSVPTAKNAPTPEQLQQEMLAAFSGEIERVRPPLTYRFGILLAAFVMVLLPIIYIALIILTGWLVFYHMSHNASMLGMGRGRGMIIVVLLYLTPLIAGSIMIFFMVKPFFARSASQGRKRSLTRKSEPTLFAFVDRICDVVGAAKPKRVDIDCQVNASASFRRGWLSMITGRDLVLTIGMPLVAGLNMRQFGGVLAHEFGHFSQGAGMRLTFIVRTISYWFTRVVYERDAWDEWLREASSEADFRIAMILNLAQGCVWLTRGILWVLMMTGNLVSGFLLRQMEFDADRYETRLAGSEAFEQTSRRLGEINVANSIAMSSLGQYYSEGKLGDNLPRLIDAKLDDLSGEIRDALSKTVAESETTWFSTHPSDKDRIASAHRENAEGIFALERPAPDLFCFYKESCENVTFDFYRDALGQGVKKSDLNPIGELLEQHDKQKSAREALDRFFCGTFNVVRPLRLPSVHIATQSDSKEALATLKRSRQEMEGLKDDYYTCLKKYDEADSDVVHHAAAVAVYRTEISPPKKMFRSASRKEARDAKERAETIVSRAENDLANFESSAGKRLYAGVQLLRHPQIAAKVDDSKALIGEVNTLLPLTKQLGGKTKTVLRIRDQMASLSALLSQLSRLQSHEQLINGVLGQSRNLCGELSELRKVFAETPYPFDHRDKDAKLGSFLVPQIPTREEVGAVHDVADQAVDRFLDLQQRIVSRLVEIADQVEVAIGLPPLKKSGV